MPVKFNVVARANPSNREAPSKYYPSIVSSGRVTQRQLAEMAASISTLSSADLAAALEIFLTIIPKELARGNIVELGDFGNFWLKANSEGVETPEAVRASQIATLTAQFKPGKEFRKVLSGIDFEKA